jgi:hypothetical protein
MSVPGGVAPPPGGWGETQPLRLQRLDGPSRPRRLLAEEFFAGPIAPAGGPSPLAHRWASGLAAAALSLTLVVSMVALAILGGGGDPGGQFSQAPLLAEGRGDVVRAATPRREEPNGGRNAPAEAAVVAPPAAPAPPTAPAPPASAPVTEEPVAQGGGGEEGSGSTDPAGGGGGDSDGGGDGGTGTEVVPPIDTGTVGGVQPIAPVTPVAPDTDEDGADTTPGSEGEAQDEEDPQPPPEELPPCTVNEEEENGSDDEGADSADEDEDGADQDASDDSSDDSDSEDSDDDPVENGSDA